MFPVFLGGFIRLVISSWQLSYGTFTASELAICLALLALLTNQSLLQHEELLNNLDKEADIATQAVACLVFAAVLLVLFALIVGFSSAIEQLHLEALQPSLQGFENFVYILSPIIIGFAILTQRSFRLKARL
jgi:heme exporter protein D